MPDAPPEHPGPAYDDRPGYDTPTGGRGYPGPTEPAADAEPDDAWARLDDADSAAWSGRGDDVATPFRRRKGGLVKRFGKVPMTVLTVVVVLAVLAGGGYLLWTSTQNDASESKYFDELTVTRVISRVEKEGFECVPGRTIAQCEKSIKGADLSITVHFGGETEVKKIEASGGTAAYTDEEVPEQELQAFFAMAATLPHSGGSGAAAKAKAWVADRVNKGGTKTFGGVRYESASDQPLITMVPA